MVALGSLYPRRGSSSEVASTPSDLAPEAVRDCFLVARAWWCREDDRKDQRRGVKRVFLQCDRCESMRRMRKCSAWYIK